MRERLAETRLLWVTNVPAPYRLEMFESIRAEFEAFHVAFLASFEAGRHWDMRPNLPYPAHYLEDRTIGLGHRRLQVSPGLQDLVRKTGANLVVGGGFSPSIAGLARDCARQRIPFVLLNDGTIDTDPGRGVEFAYRRWIASKACAFLAASSGGASYFLRLGARSEDVVVSHLTRDLQPIAAAAESPEVRARARLRWNLHGPTACYAGQLIERKRPLDALAAYLEYDREHPGLAFVIAGDGPQLPELQEVAKDADHGDVRFLGHLEFEELTTLLSVCDLAIFPSVHEPYGMVVIESLAAGVPVVATPQVGAAVDLLQHGRNGYFVPPRDPAAIARVMRAHFAPSGAREQLSKAARELARAHDLTIEREPLLAALERARLATPRGRWRLQPTGGDSKRLVVLTRILPPYRVPVFRELTQRGIPSGVIVAGQEADALPAATMREMPGEVAIRWSPRSSVVRRDVVGHARSLNSGLLLVEQGARLGFAWSALCSRRRGDAPRVLWTHGIENRERVTRHLTPASHGRWMQVRLANGVLCYDDETAALMRHRFPGKVVDVARNSTDGRPILAECGPHPSASRVRRRRESGLEHEFYLLLLGRLVPEKRPNHAVDILHAVRRVHPDTGLIVVGDGPLRDDLRRHAENSGLMSGRDMVLVGETWDAATLARWLHCGDLHLNPGFAGLNVVDALFAGLPTVLPKPTEAGPFHGPEWNYLKQCGGLFAKDDTVESLAARVIEYLSMSPGDRAELEAGCVRYATENLGVPQMVDGMARVAAVFGLAWPPSEQETTSNATLVGAAG